MDNQHLTACLILHQQQKDNALGIEWQSSKLRGLTWYYVKVHTKRINDFVTAAKLNELIQTNALQISQLVKLAETESINKQDILNQVIELKSKVDEAASQLNSMALLSEKHSVLPGQFEQSHNQKQTSHNMSTLQRLTKWLSLLQLKVRNLLTYYS